MKKFIFFYTIPMGCIYIMIGLTIGIYYAITDQQHKIIDGVDNHPFVRELNRNNKIYVLLDVIVCTLFYVKMFTIIYSKISY